MILMWTSCHALFASSHIWAFGPWCASCVSLTRPRNAWCRYFDIWWQRCRPLVQIPTEILTLLQIPTELDISKARLGDISRMSPILRRYQQRYPKTCQHKIHDNLRFGEEEDATSRTFLKKIMSKPIFITPLIQSTPRPC